jgi:hypothetical protein
MPGPNDNDNESESTEEETTEETEETTEGGSSEESEGASNDPKTDKRISDLQSKADAETARANKAEAALKARLANKDNVADPAAQAMMQELREASLDAIYGENPVLKQYGIERSLIEGSTRAELRESASSVVALIKSVSTRVRNETLTEHGLKAEPAGSTREQPRDYASMKDEDFLKLLDSI